MNSKQIAGQIRRELESKARSKSEEEKEKAKATLGNEAKFWKLRVPEAKGIAEPFAKKDKNVSNSTLPY